jgi:(heptosyl)LPS beta-1,4-glucosyltransferase
MGRISVAISCANVEDTLEAACQSVKWADELVIVDSGSKDATATIAKAHADRYVVEKWRGYTEQKKFAASLCRNDWVFILDGDEECAPGLAREIQALGADDFERVDLFTMRRRNYLAAREVRDWSPDWMARLYNRNGCDWADELIHDRIVARDPNRVAKLRGWIDHKRLSRAGYRDLFDGAAADARASIVAEDLFRKGRRANFTDLWFRPTFAFLKFYFLKGNFLDGQFGLMVAQRAAIGTQQKYAALWARQRGLVARGETSSGAEHRQASRSESPRQAT